MVHKVELSYLYPLYRMQSTRWKVVDFITEMVEKHTFVWYGMGYAYTYGRFGKWEGTQNPMLFDN